MSRSHWKGYILNKNLIKSKNKKNFFQRNNSINSNSINKFLLINNGQTAKKIMITREMVGYKIGEFSQTRKYTKKLKKTRNEK